MREAQRQAEEAGTPEREDVPPRGWATSAAAPPSAPDLQALVGLIDWVRSAVPPDLSRQLAEALRDLLLALRALLDWYIERLGEPAPGPPEVDGRGHPAGLTCARRRLSGAVADPRTRIPPSAAKALRGLTPELRLAGAAAAALLFTMILPWYEKSYFATTGRTVRPVSDNLSALQVFSFVEAAVLLVAAGVLYLIWARSQNKAFHLPGGDGTVIMAAGGVGAAAARLAPVRQARRRRPGRDRRHPVGDLRRAARRRPR